MIKNSKVNDFISSKHLNFIANYETKSEVVHEGFYHLRWGIFIFILQVEFCSSVGNINGYLSISYGSRGKTMFLFYGLSFVGVYLDRGLLVLVDFVVNVYFKGSLAGKK